jgi:hypothetical protein
MASWGWAAAAGAAAISLAASSVAAAPSPNRDGWSQRIDRDLAQDNAADLAVALRQLQDLVQGATGPRAAPGARAAAVDLFGIAYGKAVAKCPPTKAAADLAASLARMAPGLGQPVRAKAACPAGAAAGGAYTIVGGGNGLKVSGRVADISRPFTVQGTIIGGTASFTFTPDSKGALTGAVSYTIAGSGATGSGKGTWRMQPGAGGVITLTDHVSGCVRGGGCRATTETFKLTPTR